MAATKLNERQKRFVEEYLVDFNATQAAIRAGYSPDTAGEQGSALLKNLKVRAHLDKALARRSRRTGVTADRVIQEYARIAFAVMPNFIDLENAEVLSDASEDDKAVIQSVKVKRFPTKFGEGVEREIKLADKVKALDKLAEHLGMFETRKSNVPGVLDQILEAVKAVD